tara:strand:- start:926 stop:1849 length:924 start_codon:yes stop_codon:yes gene_type:complete
MEIQGQEIRMATLGGNRYNRMNTGSRAAGQGGSSTPMPKFAKATPGVTPRGGFNLGNLGGMLSGFANKGNSSVYGEQEVADIGNMRDEIYDRTQIDVTGIGYENKFDENGNLISNLTGVNKDIYDQSGDLTTMFGNQMKDYNSGGFEAMEQRRLERMRALTSEDNERRAQQIRERNLNTGASSYGVMQGQLAENNYLNQQDLGYQNNAFSQAIAGGNYLSNQRAGTQNSMQVAAGNANSMLTNQMAKVDATTGYDLEADAITGLYNQKAVAANTKANSKNKFWGNLLEFGGNALMPGAGTVAKGLFT